MSKDYNVWYVCLDNSCFYIVSSIGSSRLANLGYKQVDVSKFVQNSKYYV